MLLLPPTGPLSSRVLPPLADDTCSHRSELPLQPTPQLLAARTYDIGPDALGFDFDTSWERCARDCSYPPRSLDPLPASLSRPRPWRMHRPICSELVAQLEAVPMEGVDDFSGDGLRAAVRGARVPVTVRNLRFSGPVRVIITHLTAEDPGAPTAPPSLPSRTLASPISPLLSLAYLG